VGRLRRITELIENPYRLFRRFKVLGEAKMAAKHALPKASKLLRRTPLDRESTVRLLAGHEIAVAKHDVLHLPSREPLTGGPPHPVFGEWDVKFEPEYVWSVERNERIRSMRITSAGTILLNGKSLLDTDFGSVQGMLHLPLKRLRRGRPRRRRVDVDIAIAPWSHSWATYYEYVAHLLSKLCRIKEIVDSSTWSSAKVCYSLFDTPYERQYLSLLGLHEDALLNTNYIDPVPQSMIISNLQRHRLLTPTRITSLRNAFLGEAQGTKNGGRRMYLSREGAKREVLNEAEVRQVVSSYDLEVIESMPVDVEEQIRMFSEASLIVSPHGSGLTNLVWCSPGTRVIELFTASFLSHLYSHISHVLRLRHVYLVDNAREPHHWTHMHKDMVVDVRALATALEDASA
jgi:capsular polysaccharide biosynthesis protein